MRSVLLLLAVAAIGAWEASPARADILAGPNATKLCAGADGGGIGWSISLNEGWRFSPLIRYRVILRDPKGRIIGPKESARLGGAWLGPFPYWDNGNLAYDLRGSGENSLAEPTPGIYTFALQLRVDPRYPDIGEIGQNNFNWPAHAGEWISETWKIHVYRCP